MLVVIPNVISSTQLKQIQPVLEAGRYINGRLSAGQTARDVKNNQELSADSVQLEQLNKLVMGTLVQNKTYQAATMPHRVATPYYARYRAGMGYGDHVDDPVMGPPGGQYRSDISITVFLNAPDQYEGGELVIRTSYGNQSIKLDAGSCVIYPSSSLHQVADVTSGERLVAVTWVQSMIRDPQQRELLYRLYQARETLRKEQPGTDAATQVDQVYVNLVRMWSEL